MKPARIAIIVGTVVITPGALFIRGGGSPPIAPEFYVAPTGNDSNQGTLAAPFLTAPKAQQAVRASLPVYPDVTVWLRGGFTQLTSTLALTSADSGASGHKVTWASYPGEEAILSGGDQVTGWTVCMTADLVCNSGDGTTYQATVTSPTDFREFYFCPDGTFATCEHRPVSHTTSPFPGGFTVNTSNGAVTAPGGATAPFNTMGSWGNPTDVEVVYQNIWEMPRCKAATISGSTITLQTPCATAWNGWFYNQYSSAGGVGDFLYALENAYEFLTNLGDVGCGSGSGCYYLNKTTHVLYYQPKAGENMATGMAVVPAVEKLLTQNGVSNVTFDRITFAFSTWLSPNQSGNGYLPVQSGYWCTVTATCQQHRGTPLGAAVVVTGNSHDLTYNHIRCAHTAARCAFFEHGTQTVLIDAPDFKDNGGGALQYGDITDAAETNPALQTAGLTLRNYRVGPEWQYMDAGQVFVPYARDYLIMQGEHDSANWVPIATNWGGWTASLETGYSKNIELSKIFVNGYCGAGSLFDCGGFYNIGATTGTVAWKDSYVKGKGPAPLYSKGAFYPDERSAGITISNNVVEGPDSALNCTGLTSDGGGCAIFIWENLIGPITATSPWWSTSNQNLDRGTGDSIAAPTVFTAGSPPAGAQTVINAAGISAGVTPGP